MPTRSHTYRIDRDRTAFVIGAGASVPYGFPTGRGLVDVVCKHAHVTSGLGMCGHTEAEIASFRAQLRDSLYASVDAFLEARQDLRQIGKRAIAAVLVPLEADHLVRKVSPAQDWLGWLFGLANQRDLWPRLTFITFNYDRVLEHFFARALQSCRGCSREDSENAVAHLDIIHLYGCLGNYPGCGPDSRPFEPASTKESINLAADGIRILPEGEKHPDGFARAKAALDGSQLTVFLGFGYHRTNLARLRGNPPYHASGWPAGRCVIGTGFQVEAAERQAVEANLELTHMGEPVEDCLLFLRRHTFCP